MTERQSLTVFMLDASCYGRTDTPPIVIKHCLKDSQVGRTFLGEPMPKTDRRPSWDQVAILRKRQTESVIGDLMAASGRSNRTKFRDRVLNPLLPAGLIEMTIPDKHTSRLQKYRLTDKGRVWLVKAKL